MTVLITGGDGQLGRALMAAVPKGFRAFSIQRGELDVTDPAAVRERILDDRPALVVNAAAYTAVDRAESEEELATRVNSLGAGYVASAAAEARCRMIQVSTDFVFDGSEPTPRSPDDAAK